MTNSEARSEQEIMLKDINFFTTYRCNSRCRNCLIWKNTPPSGRPTLTWDQFMGIISDPMVSPEAGVGFAGGEPTISRFFWNALEWVPEHRHITITTNGLNHERLIAYLSGVAHPERFMVQVSLDGIDEVNDQIRGIPGGYQKAFHLIRSLEQLGIARLISFTLNRFNCHQLWDMYQLAHRVGARFSTRIAHVGGAYGNRENRDLVDFSPRQLEILDQTVWDILQKEIQKPDHVPEQLVFLKHMVGWQQGRGPQLRCHAMASAAVIDCYGDVFPNCPAVMVALGNVTQADLSTIFTSDNARSMIRKIETRACGGCWNDCQMVTNIASDRDFFEREYGIIKIALFHGPLPDVIFPEQPDHPLLVSGWYDPEGIPGSGYRWTQQEFSFLVPPQTHTMVMSVMLPPSDNPHREPKMTIYLDGNHLDQIRMTTPGWTDYPIRLNAPVTDVAICRIQMDAAYCPKTAGDGPDQRQLGMVVRKIAFER